ncbi:unnamed protein product, partial [Rotaria sp. Silwood2]
MDILFHQTITNQEKEKKLAANKGLMSTSNPTSVKADAITLAPQSSPF